MLVVLRFSNDFNPRSREGSDPDLCAQFLNTSLFQSTLPRRERHRGWRCWIFYRQFQSTLPRRERLFNRVVGDQWESFQSTLPRRERHKRRADYAYLRKNFNPRSREGSDGAEIINGQRLIKISIHAPAKGATSVHANDSRDIHISIHAPAKGATRCRGSHSFLFRDFNPRSREGSDSMNCTTSL